MPEHDVSLREHVEALIAANDQRYDQRFQEVRHAVDVAFVAQREAIKSALDNADRAVAKAEAAAEKRFEGLNEFRAQLGDQQRTLMPRTETERLLSVLSEKISVLEAFRTEMLSRGTGAREGYVWAVGLVGLILTILSIVLLLRRP